MALREVKPLNADQWKLVTNALKVGPSEEQRNTINTALKRAKELREIKN
ncbi:hypothetical protein [Nitrosopumilus sp.]|nr:hypothetical protein [Nitrosopumilus sp.]